jgi:protein-tyrosine phosphatase
VIDHYTWIDTAVAVGRCPTEFERPWLATEGITGLLTLQSDSDLVQRDIDWVTWTADYAQLGIEATRVSVTDFDRGDLLNNLDTAVAQLQRLVEKGRRVYVHCNAGINRSPSTVIAWLVAHRGHELEAATQLVCERHSPCYPYPDVMVAWVQRRCES